MTLKIGALTELVLFLPVVCFVHVFEQTLAEQLYRDKGLLTDYLSLTSCRFCHQGSVNIRREVGRREAMGVRLGDERNPRNSNNFAKQIIWRMKKFLKLQCPENGGLPMELNAQKMKVPAFVKIRHLEPRAMT